MTGGPSAPAVAERSEAFRREMGLAPNGDWGDWSDLLPVGTGRRAKRDLSVGTFGSGGAFVQTEVADSVIDVLRNQTVVLRLGPTILRGLRGNLALPRQTSPATAQSLGETATVTKSSATLDQVLLAPKRVTCSVEYSRELFLQSSVDIENFVRDDIAKTIGVKLDRLMLAGAGANSEPTGILNTVGVGTTTFGGAATWAAVVGFHTALAKANAVPENGGSLSYVTSPNVEGKWRVTPVLTAANPFPLFLWKTGKWADGTSDGEVNGRRACATQQLGDSDTVIYGNWADFVIGFWGGYDLTINPFSRDTDAVVRLTMHVFFDCACRHAASFVVSTDSGAQ